jgi:hypothetical protein
MAEYSAGDTGGKKRPVIVMITRWAAAACILALAGIGAWYMISEKKTAPYRQPTQKRNQPSHTRSCSTTTGEITKKMNLFLLPKQQTYKQTQTRNTQHTACEQPGNIDNLQNLENSFTQVINLQRDRVSSMPMYAESPEYFNDFKVQIKQMEKDEKVIKSDIAKRGMNDQLLDQLINLYQQKLNTLKQLQTEMNKTNNRYKQSRGPVDSTKTYFLNL